MAVPVITRSFASERIRLGNTWKVYLNASDPDGEMQVIVCTLEQPGVGVHPVGLTRVPAGARQKLSGYVYLTTVGAQGLNNTRLGLTIQIRDQNGNYSAPVSFSLTFDPRSQPEDPPAGIFQEYDLGPIMITLTSASGG
jgi:hypothetical protein